MTACCFKIAHRVTLLQDAKVKSFCLYWGQGQTRFSNILTFFKRTLIGLLCCLGFLLLALQVPFVKKVVLEKTIEYVLDEPHHSVLVEGARGFFPFSLRVSKCSIKDGAGPWLV